MKKLLPLLATLMLAGCLATENIKVEITSRGIAPTTSNTVWWRTPYRADRKADNVWDQKIPREDLPQSQHSQDPLDAEVEFFEKNVIKWPKTMPPAYKPPPVWVNPAPKVKSKSDAILREKMNQPLVPKGEVY